MTQTGRGKAGLTIQTSLVVVVVIVIVVILVIFLWLGGGCFGQVPGFASSSMQPSLNEALFLLFGCIPRQAGIVLDNSTGVIRRVLIRMASGTSSCRSRTRCCYGCTCWCCGYMLLALALAVWASFRVLLVVVAKGSRQDLGRSSILGNQQEARSILIETMHAIESSCCCCAIWSDGCFLLSQQSENAGFCFSSVGALVSIVMGNPRGFVQDYQILILIHNGQFWRDRLVVVVEVILLLLLLQIGGRRRVQSSATAAAVHPW